MKLLAAYVAFAERHTRSLLLGLFALMLVALGFATRLELHTDFAELLPDQHPAVVALRRTVPRQKSAANLVMLIHSPSADANHRFAEALKPALATMVPATFSEIQWRPDTELPEFGRHWKWLYADTKELEEAESLFDRLIAKRAQPGFVDLEGDPDAELETLRGELEQRLPAQRGVGTRYFERQIGGEHYVGVMLWQRLDGLATASAHEAKNKVVAAVAKVGPQRFHPRMAVEYTGGIAQAIDEQDGVRDDLTLSTLLCTACVLLVIYSYFRRLALIWVIGAPVVLGLLLALMLASWTIHYLNMNTAFLISIILGNGINAPIILLGRYGEERRAGLPVPEALAAAMSHSFRGITAAFAAAAIAYGCLLLTSFRGFNQFGLLGGSGMLLVGVSTFVLVPPLVLFGERRWPGLLTPRRNLWELPFSHIGGLASRQAGLLALVALVAMAAGTPALVRWLRDPLEWKLENLRSEQSASEKLWPKMEALGMGDVGAGFIGNNGVLLVDRADQADAVAHALKAQDEAKGPRLHVLKEVRTLGSMLPKDQPAKLEILARLRRKLDRHQGALGAQDAKALADWRPPDYLRLLTVDDLPKILRDAFTEIDGTRGRLIGIDADHTTYYDWNGHDLLRMSPALSVEALGKKWVAASYATVFAGMFETIIADGPRVTVAALICVTLLVVIVFGLPGALPVLLCIATGVYWLGALVGLLGLKLNFMNFVAIPITLGVGADYAANIWARVRKDEAASLREIIAHTGSAVALCSLTTIIGYSSLLLSRNRALRSFGLLADLGEITCLGAALLILPALARLFGRRPAG